MDTDEYDEATLFSHDVENDSGNNEYKYRLVNLTSTDVNKLNRQMKHRICEGDGEAKYDIGILDNGFSLGLTKEDMNESLKNLQVIVNTIDASIVNITELEVTHHGFNSHEILEQKYLSYSSRNVDKIKILLKNNTKKSDYKITRYTAHILIRENTEICNNILYIAVVGNVDAGKSSLIGVLTKGVADDGRGSARLCMFNHPHERIRGHTSSESNEIMGFNKAGKCINSASCAIRDLKWEDIVKKSTRIVRFCDLCGHEKYLKTTTSGFSSSTADYCFVLIEGKKGLTEMTRQHLLLTQAYKCPVIFIITKIDICEPVILTKNHNKVKQCITKFLGKKVFEIKSNIDVIECSAHIASGMIVPILHVSNVNGDGIDLLKMVLNYFPRRNLNNSISINPVFQVNQVFNVNGIGIVLYGNLISGRVKIGDKVIIGPYQNGEYKPARVWSIECMRVKVIEAISPQRVCFAIRGIDKLHLRKGMYLFDTVTKPPSIWKFTVDIEIKSSQRSGVRLGSEMISHIGSTRQTIKIVQIGIISRKKTTKTDDKVMKNGDFASVVLRFCFNPEYITIGQQIIIRHDLLCGSGIITGVSSEKMTPIEY